MAPRQPCKHCPDCTGRQWDLRGVITILVILLVFGLAYLKVLRNLEDSDTIAPWAASALTLVLSGYYMTKGAEKHAEAMMRRRRRGSRSSDTPE